MSGKQKNKEKQEMEQAVLKESEQELSTSQQTLLVVDDEEGICKALKEILQDEGYRVVSAGDGQSALDCMQEHSPALVLLDIWMPGMDGMETLGKMKALYPDIPVIMISGHATIATAIQATKMGAANFVEKPLDLNATLQVVRDALAGSHEMKSSETEEFREITEERLEFASSWDFQDLKSVVFPSQTLRGRKIPQRTLAASTVLYGQGLHSGTKSGLILEPLPPSSGIHFIGVSHAQPVPAHVQFVESTGFQTTLRSGKSEFATIEHLMSALYAYGISNLLVKCNGEVPVMDGSSFEFCNLIENTGVEEQSGDWFEIKVDEQLQVGEGEEFIRVEPADSLSIDYTLRYPDPIGEQRMVFDAGDVETYKKEISKARTFGFLKDIGYLQKQGLAQGGRFDNFVLLGDEGILNGELRYPDELVRHKILDALGDLYLLGRPLCAKVTASMTGHSDNVDLLKKLLEKM